MIFIKIVFMIKYKFIQFCYLSGSDDDSWAALSIYSNALDSSKARLDTFHIETYIFS
jgi:hypothetical protein